jgi:hypothetical protein
MEEAERRWAQERAAVELSLATARAEAEQRWTAALAEVQFKAASEKVEADRAWGLRVDEMRSAWERVCVGESEAVEFQCRVLLALENEPLRPHSLLLARSIALMCAL